MVKLCEGSLTALLYRDVFVNDDLAEGNIAVLVRDKMTLAPKNIFFMFCTQSAERSLGLLLQQHVPWKAHYEFSVS